jgi:asparagine synthase (glutamine-hydrolysing)
MCAIFGIYGEYNPKIVNSMAQCQKSRGPDKTSFYFNKRNKISIGMNRLSVIDKQKGNQPMLSHDKKILTIFNGVIYNFKEIKRFLEKKSINFKTNSDTEVLVNSFSFWGDKCFNYFDGMWAAAFYNHENNSLTLSRDYLGQKPLFYSQLNSKLIFSSQIEGIFKYRNDFKVSNENLELYYKFSHLPAPHTIYKKIHKLKPAEILIVDGKKINKKIFWNLSNGPDNNYFFKEIKKSNVKESFKKNLENYLISDKDSILSLSSGKDSQILNNLIGNTKKISTITIGYKDSSYDESRLIDKNSKNEIKILDQKKALRIFLKLKHNLVFFNGDGSFIPTYFLFNQIKKKTNVAISGDGGDEVFFGYITFKAFYIYSIIKFLIPQFILNIIKNLIKLKSFSNSYLSTKKKISLFINNLDKELYVVNSHWLNDYENDEIQNLVGQKKNQFIFKYLKKLFNKHSRLKFAQLYYFKFYLPMVLEKIDHASMLNSVENRSPYLNKDLLNFTLSYDVKKNFSIINEKKLMKDIFRNSLQKKFRNIKKHGFAFPKSLILKDNKLVKKIIKDKFLTKKIFFYKKYNEYLMYNLNEIYLWNELILNISRQNLEKNG